MKRHTAIARGVWALLGVAFVVAALGFVVPRVHPVSLRADPELIALRNERAALAGNDDVTLGELRRQAAKKTSAVWSETRFVERIGTDWRVEWQQPAGESRTVLVSRSAPRLPEWSVYVGFIKQWANEPGITLESLDLTASGGAQQRRLEQVSIGLRLVQPGEMMSSGPDFAPIRPGPPGAPAAGFSSNSQPPKPTKP